MKIPPKVNRIIQNHLENALNAIGNCLDSDAMCVYGPIFPPIDRVVYDAMEGHGDKKEKVAVVLNTGGGEADVAEKIVKIIRHNYKEVSFIIPDIAMSAGTMMAMSGDRILMNYASCLGPIDAQIEEGDNREQISVADYLRKFEEMRKKSENGELTQADVILLENGLNLGQLERYKKEQELGAALVREWLSEYQFKGHGEKAKKVAEILNDNNRWHTHGRPIDMSELRKIGEEVDMDLSVADYEQNPDLAASIKDYFSLLEDFARKDEFRGFVQLKGFMDLIE